MIPASTSWLSPKTVMTIGLPSCLAILLTLVITGLIPTPLMKALLTIDDVKADQTIIRNEHVEMRMDNAELKEELIREIKKSNLYLERQCQNDANNDREFRNCTIPE